jgi:large subunit ribosomal protein L3
MIGIVGKKQEMTQLFSEDGTVVPVTIIEVPPCVVTQVKTVETDGYPAIQIGYGTRKRISKAMEGHLKKAKMKSIESLIEFKVKDPKKYAVGQVVDVSIFTEGETVNVSGFSKGKGFQGVVKRHGFSGGPETHGSTSHRVPGSIGSSATPAKVVKGKKMPGRMAVRRITVKNLKIVRVEKDKNRLAVGGAVPGSRNGVVMIRKTERAKG